jgi:hypothetical protein
MQVGCSTGKASWLEETESNLLSERSSVRREGAQLQHFPDEHVRLKGLLHHDHIPVPVHSLRLA